MGVLGRDSFEASLSLITTFVEPSSSIAYVFTCLPSDDTTTGTINRRAWELIRKLPSHADCCGMLVDDAVGAGLEPDAGLAVTAAYDWAWDDPPLPLLVACGGISSTCVLCTLAHCGFWRVSKEKPSRASCSSIAARFCTARKLRNWPKVGLLWQVLLMWYDHFSSKNGSFAPKIVLMSDFRSKS